MRVLGYIMARDEWPMLELAITHALLHHVDEVVAVDHGSTDETRERLPQLEARWRGRLRAFRLDGVPYFQEAVTLAALAPVPLETFDWVYVFDADEFLVTKTGDLRDYLHDVEDRCDVVRYQVLNFLTRRDFDERDLSDYPSITARADAARFLPIADVTTAEEIEFGDANFYDVPFAPKLIVRSAKDLWIEAGAHGLYHPDSRREISAPASEVYAAHLPLPSWPRVQRKVLQGRDLIAQGFDSGHGWQSQMLAHLEDAGQLEAFWETHSLGEQRSFSRARAQPVYTHDESFSLAIRSTVDSLLIGPEPEPVNVNSEPRQIDAATYLRVIHGRLQTLRAVSWERDALARERDEVVRDRDEIARKRDDLAFEVAGLRERYVATQAQLDATEAHARRLADVMQGMESSSSWRLTKPLRELMHFLRRVRRRSGTS